MAIYERLMKVVQMKGAGYLALLDPDRMETTRMVDLAVDCERYGVDGLLVGSSLLLYNRFDETIREIKRRVRLPVIIFPGSSNQVSKHADAILFLSLISGRNPDFLIGEQVKAAPLIKEYGLEALPTGYMIIESGGTSSVQYMSHTQPIPRNKPDIAKAHALAAQYLGMKFVFLEAGSGARNSVSDEIIRAISTYVNIPIITGGGVREPSVAADKVRAGASFVVVGNIFEEGWDRAKIESFATSIHSAGGRR